MEKRQQVYEEGQRFYGEWTAVLWRKGSGFMKNGWRVYGELHSRILTRSAV